MQANYDELKVPEYELPELLTGSDGRQVSDAATWVQRRQEILELFETHVYGRTPAWTGKPDFEVSSRANGVLDGTAIRKEITARFTEEADGPALKLLIYLPAGARQPVPLFLALNFGGNHTIHKDPGITLGKVWKCQGSGRCDQHMLIALIAPRPVYVASARQDQWADPRGECLSLLATDSVYKLLGTDGLGTREIPDVNRPIHNTRGYHLRRGKHDLKPYDWRRYLDFPTCISDSASSRRVGN